MADFVRKGLDALEAYHSKHDACATARYLEMASSFGIAVTGGSDYHADEERAHFELLTREYRALGERQSRRRTARRAAAKSAQ